MLMEMLFCIMFFVLPLAGMCIALVISGFQAEHTLTSRQVKVSPYINRQYINKQSRSRQIRGVDLKTEDKHPEYFFKQYRNKGAKSWGFVDTS